MSMSSDMIKCRCEGSQRYALVHCTQVKRARSDAKLQMFKAKGACDAMCDACCML